MCLISNILIKGSRRRVIALLALAEHCCLLILWWLAWVQCMHAFCAAVLLDAAAVLSTLLQGVWRSVHKTTTLLCDPATLARRCGG